MGTKLRRPGTIDEVIDDLYGNLIAGSHYEKTYPWDSIGTTVVAGNTVWGASVVIIPTDTLKSDYGWTAAGDLVPYVVVGFQVASSANPTNTNVFQIFRVDITTLELLNGTSGFGVANPDRILIADTSGFLDGDVIWVMDDNSLDGEIAVVESIVENTHLDTDKDFLNAYTVVANAKVYLLRRVDTEHRTIWGKFSAATVKDSQRFILHAPRLLNAGDGLIARAYGIEGASTIYITALLHTETP